MSGWIRVPDVKMGKRKKIFLLSQEKADRLRFKFLDFFNLDDSGNLERLFGIVARWATNIPEDYVLVYVGFDYRRDVLAFVAMSKSFDIVPWGQELPAEYVVFVDGFDASLKREKNDAD